MKIYGYHNKWETLPMKRTNQTFFQWWNPKVESKKDKFVVFFVMLKYCTVDVFVASFINLLPQLAHLLYYIVLCGKGVGGFHFCFSFFLLICVFVTLIFLLHFFHSVALLLHKSFDAFPFFNLNYFLCHDPWCPL